MCIFPYEKLSRPAERGHGWSACPCVPAFRYGVVVCCWVCARRRHSGSGRVPACRRISANCASSGNTRRDANCASDPPEKCSCTRVAPTPTTLQQTIFQDPKCPSANFDLHSTNSTKCSILPYYLISR
jgi:hypothetical protein